MGETRKLVKGSARFDGLPSRKEVGGGGGGR